MTDAARRILLGILLLGVIGLSAELLLLKHTEDASQWIPLALNDHPSRTIALRATAKVIAGSAVGELLHGQGGKQLQVLVAIHQASSR